MSDDLHARLALAYSERDAARAMLYAARRAWRRFCDAHDDEPWDATWMALDDALDVGPSPSGADTADGGGA